MEKIYTSCVCSFLYLIFCVCNNPLSAQSNRNQYPLIPYPVSLISGNDHFAITPATEIVVTDSLFKNEVAAINIFFENSFGKPLKQSREQNGYYIRFIYDASVKSPEGYHLTITAKQVLLSAKTPAGMFMAVQTVRQLLPPSVEKNNDKWQKSLTLPAVNIKN